MGIGQHRLASAFLTISLLFIPHLAHSREMSKAGQVFESVRDGVVTIINGGGHGSGFLASSRGLVLTNSHVVRESGDNLRVRFGTNEIVTGKVLVNNRDADVAVIHVNLQNIKHPVVLPLFTPADGDPLVLVGEKVLAIGSPIEWETLEKIMTEGVVGKFEHDVIRHDASVNGGNSGGPLLNFDGKVVGLNTFVTSAHGPAISGTVAINKALPVLKEAENLVDKAPPPSPDLLPEVSQVPFTHDLMKQASQGKDEAYKIGSRYFDTQIWTPPVGYRKMKSRDERVLAKRKKRGEKKGFTVGEDEYESANEFKFYDYQKPVVTILVKPNPHLTTGSIVSKMVLAAAFGAPGLFAHNRYEVKRDFLNLTLKTKSGAVACQSLTAYRSPFTEDIAEWIGDYSFKMQEKSYIGYYEFDAHCFESKEPLQLVIETEGDDAPIAFSISTELTQMILEDFKPYWNYVATLAQQAPKAADATADILKQLATGGESTSEHPKMHLPEAFPEVLH